MKNLLIVIIGLTSILTSARDFGTPDQDPIVKKIRENFETGSEPTEELLVGKNFSCKEFMAVRNNFNQSDFKSSLSFDKYYDFLTSHQPGSSMDKIMYTNNGQELIGSKKVGSRTFYDAYRFDANGNLISEFSIESSGLKGAELEPLADSKGKVFSYTVCIPKL